jgi:uncharacterized protein involved in response to NO
MTGTIGQRLTAAALFSSGFRPFFLLAAIYGPFVIATWFAPQTGFWSLFLPTAPAALGHAHELLFGFAVAIVCGVLLTALPSWSGAQELRGGRLAALALLWMAGRAVVWSAPALPTTLVALIDCALLPVLGVLLAPAMRGARMRLFVWTLPPLVALALANGLYHLAMALALDEGARWSIRLGLYALAFLYSLYGGLLTPAFTRSFLRARGEPSAAIHVPIEYLTAAAMLVLAALDLAAAPGRWIALAAFVAVALHLVRFARWRGWRTASDPLLWTLHLGYLWFIVAIALRGLAETGSAVPRDAWVHAFTVGALGLTMAGLMTRVVLRHTGRALAVVGSMVIAYGALFAAAVLRLAVPLAGAGAWAITAAAVLWALAFAIYLVAYGAMLLRPSLPRTGQVR